MTKEYFISKWTAPQFKGSTYKEFCIDVESMLKTEQAKNLHKPLIIKSVCQHEPIDKDVPFPICKHCFITVGVCEVDILLH